MSDDEKRAVFRVLQGGQGATPAERVQLSPTGIQLGLPRISTREARIISVGWDGLSWDDFVTLLRVAQPSRVVDIRVSPSFQALNIKPEQFAAMLNSSGAEYVHAPALANTFVGEHWNPAVALEQFQVYLRSRDSELQQLRAWVSAGPVLLLGRSRNHVMSERSILVDALGRIDPGFTLEVKETSGRY